MWIAWIEVLLLFTLARAKHVPHEKEDDSEKRKPGHSNAHVFLVDSIGLALVTVIRVVFVLVYIDSKDLVFLVRLHQGVLVLVHPRLELVHLVIFGSIRIMRGNSGRPSK